MSERITQTEFEMDIDSMIDEIEIDRMIEEEAEEDAREELFDHFANGER